MSVLEQAKQHGVDVLDEERYAWLQHQYPIDEKTSSWLKTPKPIREAGGALFGERRYGRVFTFHNGADSYYRTRGWRGLLMLKL